MKTQSFTLNNKELLLVEYEHPVERETTRLLYSPEIATPYKEFKLIGKLPEVTEDKFAQLVESDSEYGVIMYRNYRTTSMAYYDEQLTAKESFFSKLEAEGIEFDHNRSYLSHLTQERNEAAQEKVFNIENTYLFEKV